MAYMDMATIIMAYIVMAYIVMAYIVMAYIVKAYMDMTYIIVAYTCRTGVAWSARSENSASRDRTAAPWRGC